MKQTEEIRKKMAQTSSFIQDDNLQKKKVADEIEMNKQVQEIKEKVFGKRSNASQSRQRLNAQYYSDGFGDIN